MSESRHFAKDSVCPYLEYKKINDGGMDWNCWTCQFKDSKLNYVSICECLHAKDGCAEMRSHINNGKLDELYEIVASMIPDGDINIRARQLIDELKRSERGFA